MSSLFNLVPISELFNVTSSKRVFKNEWTDSGIPFYRAREIVKLAKNGHVNNELYISTSMYEDYKAKYGSPKEGDILVTGVGTIGVTYLVQNHDKFYFKDGNIVWFKKKGNVCSKYVQYAFKTDFVKRQISSTSEGATVGTFTISNANKILIPLPPLAVQERIAEILDAADALRQKDQQLLQKYEQLSQSIFLDMFGDPVSNPKGWEKKPFQIITKNYDSKRIPVKQSERQEMRGKFPYYGATGIVDYVNDYLFDGLYLLVAEDGKNLVNRKKPIAWIVNGKFWVNNHAHIVKPCEEINIYFLKSLLNSIDISNYVTGIDQFKLNKSNLNRIEILLPDLKLQMKYEESCKSILKQQGSIHEQIKKSEALFQSLLQKAFKGELVNE